MKQRAVLFSLLVVVVSLIVLSLFVLTFTQRNSSRENVNTLTALNVVNNRFNNILQDIVLLNRTGKAREFQQRSLPFSYYFDKNSLTIFQEFPITKPRISNFIDIMNGYRIFISDTNAETTFTGAIIDLNVARNASWGGNTSRAHFTIEPQCLRYVLFDENTALLREGKTFNNCSNDFNIFASVKEYDLNIVLKNSTDDYNSVSCNFSGFAGCPDQSFSPSNPNPYFDFSLNDLNCANCFFIPSLKRIRAHFDPSAENTIVISCSPSVGICTSLNPIRITLSSDLNVNYVGAKTFDSMFKINFKQNIESFHYSDYNLTVSKPEYNIVKASRG